MEFSSDDLALDANDRERVDQRIADLLAEGPPQSRSGQEFLGRQFDLGLAWLHFPEGSGGLGMNKAAHSYAQEKLLELGAPQHESVTIIGRGMAAPTLVSHGTAEQQETFLRPLFTGEEVWCQLFSEPSAGSDLAGLATRAHQEGAEWVIRGQKVWTTIAHVARWGMLLTRTDPSLPKHKGLTFFILDMQAPGVEIRPLFQMTGEAEFNEVFLDDVRIFDSRRVGRPGDGWQVALTTLMNERVTIGGETPPRGSGPIEQAMDAWSGFGTPGNRDRMTQLWIRAEVLRLMNIRAANQALAGTPGPIGSIGKLYFGELIKDLTEFVMELLGLDATLKPDGYPMIRPLEHREVSHQHAYLRAQAASIEGGTSNIMRNILAERVLQLPQDMRVDKDVPWNQVPRS